MRSHQECDPEDATIAALGDAKFEKRDDSGVPWHDRDCPLQWLSTYNLIRYGATFWKKVEPEPGCRLLEDHERTGKKPKGCRILCKDGRWFTSHSDDWLDDFIYAVPIKQVVALACGVDYNSEWHMAKFQTPELRDRAVREANEREK